MDTRMKLAILASLIVMSGCASESATQVSGRLCYDTDTIYMCSLDKLCAQGNCIAVDDDNCGEYGKACGSNERCVLNNEVWTCLCAGTSQCLGAQLCCSEGCVDANSDDNNCGGCGIRCTPNEQVCSNGVCVATAYCGDGNIDKGEVCDSSNVNQKTCKDLVGYGSEGTVRCNASCNAYDLSACSPSLTCGNQKIDTDIGEECDLNADGVAMFASGNRKCSVYNPQYDDSKELKCTGCLVDASDCVSRCGNGKIDSGEVCDTTEVNKKTCEELVGYGSEGRVTCNNACSGYDLSDCSGVVTCGNGRIDTAEGEECDDGVEGNVVFRPDKSSCSKVDSKFDDSGAITCQGCAIDSTACVTQCGNGKIDVGEVCDVGTDRASGADDVISDTMSCVTEVGYGSTGKLACNSDCTGVLTSGCSKSLNCGNGKIDSGEACDLSAENVFAGGVSTCAAKDSKYSAGNLVCTENCTIDESACQLKCGNGVIDDGERCDIGVDLKEGTQDDVIEADERTCADIVGYGSTGTVRCNSTCSSLVTSCSAEVLCGNGQLDDVEKCDDTKFRDGKTSCAEYDAVYSPKTGNNVKCSDCTINYDDCVLKCGDGIVQSDEECDDKVNVTVTCAQKVGYGSEGTVKCNGCKLDLSGCSAAKNCGNGKRDTDEKCDASAPSGSQFAGGVSTCAGLNPSLYASGSLSCTSNCTLDESACQLRCGNGSVETGEVCDNKDFNGVTCKTLHGNNASGTLTCKSTCDGYTEDCQYCGDGVINNGEECDKTSLGNYTSCHSYNNAYAAGAGSISCNSSCKIDVSQCVSACTANALQCNENHIEKCSATTGLWEYSTACSGSTPHCDATSGTPKCICTADSECGDGNVCENGACLPGCVKDAVQCNGNVVEKCGSNYRWATDKTCSGQQPLCSIGNCVQCVTDADCGSGKTCSSNVCVANCTEGNYRCDATGNVVQKCTGGEWKTEINCTEYDSKEPYCYVNSQNPTTYDCKECLSSPQCGTSKSCIDYTCKECIDGNAYKCNSTGLAVLGCDSSSWEWIEMEQCGSKNQYCYVNNNDPDCVDCTTNAHCSSGTKKVCNLNAHQCVECVSSSDCTDGVNKACDINTNTCVACVDNNDCNTETQMCDATHHVCVAIESGKFPVTYKLSFASYKASSYNNTKSGNVYPNDDTTSSTYATWNAYGYFDACAQLKPEKKSYIKLEKLNGIGEMNIELGCTSSSGAIYYYYNDATSSNKQKLTNASTNDGIVKLQLDDESITYFNIEPASGVCRVTTMRWTSTK